MTKPNDSEIFKALKYCQDCPANLNFEIADLINRYKEENEKWREQFLYLDVECERLELEEENNRKEIEKLNKENDRLSQCVLYHDGIVSDLEKDVFNARVDAIREFAERLKANITINNTNDGYLDYAVDYNCLMEDIDDLVEEMVGNNNDNFE